MGPAATGNQGDYWNVVGKAWDDDHVVRELKFASGQAAPISVELVNLGGGWSSGGKLGVKAPMLDSYNYPQNNQGGNSYVILIQPGQAAIRDTMICGLQLIKNTSRKGR